MKLRKFILLNPLKIRKFISMFYRKIRKFKGFSVPIGESVHLYRCKATPIEALPYAYTNISLCLYKRNATRIKIVIRA